MSPTLTCRKAALPAALILAASLTAAFAATPADTDQPTWRATHGPLLAVAHAGSRLVAVGDRGAILLSDNQGVSWRMAQSPSPELLTDVVFDSPVEGWAVGQDSSILRTTDAGEHWTLQRAPDGKDQALFSVAVLGPSHLMATGAYALALETTDAATWTPVKLPSMDEDYHLNCVIAHGADVVITGEAGHAFVRRDGSWAAVPVPYQGSQFGCLTTPDGALYSFGLRGSMFVSSGAAPAWHRIETNEQRSIFGGTVLANGFMALVGSNGLVLLFDPQTNTFRTLPIATGASLSGVVEVAGGKWVLVGSDGVHVMDPTAAATQASEAVQ